MVSPICASVTVLMRGKHEADFADAERLRDGRLRRKRADLLDLVLLALRHQLDLHPRRDDAVEDTRQDDDAAVGVVPRVEDQRFERRVRIALRRRQPVDDRLEDLVDAGALFRARQNRLARIEPDDVFDLALGFVRLRARQIDLVDDRDDLEVVLDRQVGVRQRLRLDALRGVDEEQRAFAGGERSRHFVREIDVPWRVDQIQDVGLAIVSLVGQADGVGLDRDAALALEVHAVEDLRFHFARLQRSGHLEETVGQRRLAMVDVGDDGEVADVRGVHCVAERLIIAGCSAARCLAILRLAARRGWRKPAATASRDAEPPITAGRAAAPAGGKEGRCSRSAAGSGDCSRTARGSGRSSPRSG